MKPESALVPDCHVMEMMNGKSPFSAPYLKEFNIILMYTVR